MNYKERIKKIYWLFAQEMKQNPEFKKSGYKFAVEMEKILAEMELEIIQLETELSKQIKSERALLDIMEMYGIDLSRALSGWVDYDHVKNQKDDMLKDKYFKIPEKLKNQLTWQQ